MTETQAEIANGGGDDRAYHRRNHELEDVASAIERIVEINRAQEKPCGQSFECVPDSDRDRDANGYRREKIRKKGSDQDAWPYAITQEQDCSYRRTCRRPNRGYICVD